MNKDTIKLMPGVYYNKTHNVLFVFDKNGEMIMIKL